MPAPIRYLDVETTGLHAGAEVLEIAIVDERGEPLLNTLVRPTRELQWPEAEEIHGITPLDVVAAPMFDELTERIAAALQDAEVVIYNASFDLQFLPAAAQTWSDVHCAMLAFTDVHGEWDEYFCSRRFVSLDAAAEHVFCPIQERHRALADARRCRAVWQYLTQPSERARVDGIYHQREIAEEADYCLRDEAWLLRLQAERVRDLQNRALMSWLRFPLWLKPAAGGRSALEGWGEADVYHEAIVRLWTGCSRKVNELRRKYTDLPEYRHLSDIPKRLVPLSRLEAPRWAHSYIEPKARYVSPSGLSFRLLYRADAMKGVYAKHPLRRPFTVPRGHALYTRTQLRAAGYTRAELARMAPVAEDQNRIDWSWYPLFCLPERHVVRRREARVQMRQASATTQCQEHVP